jgi:hypothetical protein
MTTLVLAGLALITACSGCVPFFRRVRDWSLITSRVVHLRGEKKPEGAVAAIFANARPGMTALGVLVSALGRVGFSSTVTALRFIVLTMNEIAEEDSRDSSREAL